MQKLRIKRANTESPHLELIPVSLRRRYGRLWLCEHIPLVCDYMDELRQQALWDQKCIQQSKRAS